MDLAPYNVVESPAGELLIIDWEGAGPGERMAELASAAESFALLRRDTTCRELGYPQPPDRVERLDAFVRSYGLAEQEWPTLAEALVSHAQDGVAFGIQMHREGREPFASWWASDGGAGDREDLAVTEAVVFTWRQRFA